MTNKYPGMRRVRRANLQQQWLAKQEVEAAQRAAWDAAVQAMADWNAKPSEERLADARYVLHWTPWNGDWVMKGTIHMVEALESAKHFEKLCIKAAAELGHGCEPEDVVIFAQLSKEELIGVAKSVIAEAAAAMEN